MIIGIKQFNKIDNTNFAKFSGDFNPIHLDTEFASRTPYELPIVHGMQILLWSLEQLVMQVNRPVESFKVIFNKPVQLKQEIYIFYSSKTSQILVKDEKQDTLIHITDIKFLLHISDAEKNQRYSTAQHKVVLEEPNIESLVVNTQFKFQFRGDSMACPKLYPKLTSLYGVLTLCEIANLSAFVGMKIPGKHSLLRSVQIEMRRKHHANELFQLLSIDGRVGALSFLYTGQHIKALIGSFFTPKPVNLPSCNEISLSINPQSKVKNKNLLVIGGSRGIGAWAAKIFAIHGSNITLTYNTNLSLAREIKRDIISFGGKCNILKFDVLKDPVKFLSNINYKYILYFATPAITQNITGTFDNKLYKKFVDYYVESFKNIVSVLNPDCQIYFPSTTPIDYPELGFEEYIKAKKQAEEMSSYVALANSRNIVSTRIPRVLTDQNNWIFSKPLASPEIEVEKILKILV